MKDKKDIIDEIISRLKNAKELPYREGAWENFRNQHLHDVVAPSRSEFTKRRYGWSAAAAVLLLCAAGWWAVQNENPVQSPVAVQIDREVPQKIERPSVLGDIDMPTSERMASGGENIREKKTTGSNERPSVALPHKSPSFVSLPQSGPMWKENVDALIIRQSPHFDFQLPVLKQSGAKELSSLATLPPPTVFSHSSAPQFSYTQETNGSSKAFRLSDRLSLGLVVAPSSTTEKLNVGGGMLFSYRIGKKLSVRTGATFHQYEVNTLKDPLQSDVMEVAKTQESPLSRTQELYANASMSARHAYAPLIPNVNAVSGFVQTIDIPLEVKYTIYKDFYANAGVSYAAVVNQRRYAHYIENVNSSPFVKGLPSSEEEMQSSVAPVTRVMESGNENVRTSGFGGFVNMSVGKEVKVVGTKISLSVEPFVKIPIGNFKHADMNYRNGGVRIITNF